MDRGAHPPIGIAPILPVWAGAGHRGLHKRTRPRAWEKQGEGGLRICLPKVGERRSGPPEEVGIFTSRKIKISRESATGRRLLFGPSPAGRVGHPLPATEGSLHAGYYIKSAELNEHDLLLAMPHEISNVQ